MTMYAPSAPVRFGHNQEFLGPQYKTEHIILQNSCIYSSEQSETGELHNQPSYDLRNNGNNDIHDMGPIDLVCSDSLPTYNAQPQNNRFSPTPKAWNACLSTANPIFDPLEVQCPSIWNNVHIGHNLGAVHLAKGTGSAFSTHETPPPPHNMDRVYDSPLLAQRKHQAWERVRYSGDSHKAPSMPAAQPLIRMPPTPSSYAWPHDDFAPLRDPPPRRLELAPFSESVWASGWHSVPPSPPPPPPPPPLLPPPPAVQVYTATPRWAAVADSLQSTVSAGSGPTRTGLTWPGPDLWCGTPAEVPAGGGGSDSDAGDDPFHDDWAHWARAHRFRGCDLMAGRDSDTPAGTL